MDETPPIIEKQTTDFKGITAPTGDRTSVRTLIAGGLLVPFLAVYAELVDDGTGKVFYLDID